MEIAFDKGIYSDITDMQNFAKSGIPAGSITTAHFLKRFVNGTLCAHIDIASLEVSSGKMFICINISTGFGMQLLCYFLSNLGADYAFDSNS